jgi:AmmeMemoRadiSam system protein A
VFLPEEQKFLLELARRSIEHFFITGKVLESIPDLPPSEFSEKRATFVTLTKDYELRGCIGTLEAIEPLYLSVIHNSYAAAFEDDRFFPLSEVELPEISIEISILTPAKELHFTSGQELVDLLTVGVDGVVLERDGRSATFLPQVWDELLDKVEFMTALSIKAGLLPDAWREPGTKVSIYRVEVFSENK